MHTVQLPYGRRGACVVAVVLWSIPRGGAGDGAEATRSGLLVGINPIGHLASPPTRSIQTMFRSLVAGLALFAAPAAALQLPGVASDALTSRRAVLAAAPVFVAAMPMAASAKTLRAVGKEEVSLSAEAQKDLADKEASKAKFNAAQARQEAARAELEKKKEAKKSGFKPLKAPALRK